MQAFIKLSTIVTLVDHQVMYKPFVPLLNIWLELQDKQSRIKNLIPWAARWSFDNDLSEILMRSLVV